MVSLMPRMLQLNACRKSPLKVITANTTQLSALACNITPFVMTMVCCVHSYSPLLLTVKSPWQTKEKLIIATLGYGCNFIKYIEKRFITIYV